MRIYPLLGIFALFATNVNATMPLWGPEPIIEGVCGIPEETWKWAIEGIAPKEDKFLYNPADRRSPYSDVRLKAIFSIDNFNDELRVYNAKISSILDNGKPHPGWILASKDLETDEYCLIDTGFNEQVIELNAQKMLENESCIRGQLNYKNLYFSSNWQEPPQASSALLTPRLRWTGISQHGIYAIYEGYGKDKPAVITHPGYGLNIDVKLRVPKDGNKWSCGGTPLHHVWSDDAKKIKETARDKSGFIHFIRPKGE